MSCSSESLDRLIAAFHCDGLPCPDCVSTLSTEIIADLAELRERLTLIDQSKSVNRQTGTEYTIQPSDQNNIVEMENASDNTLIVPDDSTVAFPLGANLYATQVGAGTTMFRAAAGVTLNGVVAGEWYPVSQDHEVLLYKRGANEWVGIPLIAGAGEAFIFTVDTRLIESADNGEDTFEVNTRPSYGYDCTVDWGDGTQNSIDNYGDVRWVHTYDTPGIYTISILGKFGGFFQTSILGDQRKIISVDQWGDVVFDGFESAFEGARNMTSLPAGPITGATTVTNFKDAFNFTGFTTFPTGLFDLCPNAVTFQSCFQGSHFFSSIPAGLFDNCTLAENFGGVFNSTGITSIPAGLFDNNVNATNFAGAFLGTPITSVPDGLFTNCTQVVDPIPTNSGFYATFEDCTSLVTVGSGIWDGCTLVTSFVATFNGCTSLVNIDPTIFEFNTLVTSFDECFAGCTLDTEDYSNMLINLEANNPNDGTPGEEIIPGSGIFGEDITIELNAGSSLYNASAATARASLVTRLWNVIDGGAA